MNDRLIDMKFADVNERTVSAQNATRFEHDNACPEAADIGRELNRPQGFDHGFTPLFQRLDVDRGNHPPAGRRAQAPTR